MIVQRYIAQLNFATRIVGIFHLNALLGSRLIHDQRLATGRTLNGTRRRHTDASVRAIGRIHCLVYRIPPVLVQAHRRHFVRIIHIDQVHFCSQKKIANSYNVCMQ